MPLNVSHENISQDYANTEFRKGGIQPPYLIRETYLTGKSKYYCFHKSHDHITDEYTKLKDAIETLINRGWLAKHVKGARETGKNRLRENLP